MHQQVASTGCDDNLGQTGQEHVQRAVSSKTRGLTFGLYLPGPE